MNMGQADFFPQLSNYVLVVVTNIAHPHRSWLRLPWLTNLFERVDNLKGRTI